MTTNITTGQMLSDKDALGNQTTYEYDGNNRLSKVTRPEQDAVTYNYDGRGNVTQVTKVPKPNSGLASVWSGAVYEGGCANPKTCNKPTSTHDDNGHYTYYTYDGTHGGVLTVTHDAPASGAAQPQVRYSYGSFQARYQDGFGNWTSGALIYLPTGTSTCLSGSSCAGAATEAKTTIGYGNTAVANNLLPVSVENSAGNGSLSAVTTMSYDAVGNKLTETGPANVGTTRYRYDAMRQVVGVVGPAAGVSGRYRAVAVFYNADGQMTELRQGTVSSQSDGDWSNMVILQRATTIYDAQGRKAWDTVRDGGDHELLATNYRFDAANRLTSVTRPMGGSVADRSVSYSYDDAGRVTQVSGNGQAMQAITYTANGLKNTLADGKGNVTTYAYDGLSRLSQATYPTVNNVTPYETFSYDSASNLMSQRLRDGQVVTVTRDALERVTARSIGGYSYAYDNLGHVTQVTANGKPAVMFGERFSKAMSA